MEQVAQVELIYRRMFKRRVSQYGDPMAGWTMVRLSGLGVKRRPAREIIAELLAQGHHVTAGYFTTSVRGYHDHMIFWKPGRRPAGKTLVEIFGSTESPPGAGSL